MIQATAAESHVGQARVASLRERELPSNRLKIVKNKKSPKFMAAQTSPKCGVNLNQQHKTLDAS